MPLLTYLITRSFTTPQHHEARRRLRVLIFSVACQPLHTHAFLSLRTDMSSGYSVAPPPLIPMPRVADGPLQFAGGEGVSDCQADNPFFLRQ
jgi:hypothetical protein